jgi:hypothetical protein
MISSALIAQCRRESGDEPKSVRVARQGNGVVNLFNVGKFPIIEGSYLVYVNSTLQVENTDYTLDLDNGDLSMVITPANGDEVAVQFKYAEWRDKNWVEAQNKGIENLNARGFFRQVVRTSSAITLSAGKTVYNAPSACVDIYEFLVQSPQNSNNTTGSYIKPWTNWSYQQDANKLVIGSKPSSAQTAVISYLRNMQTYSATSATLDVLNDWIEPVKSKAQSTFYRSLAGKIAKQGNATVDEGHFSFTNLRTMANDMDNDFDKFAIRKKPTRPAKDMQFVISTGGPA